MSVSRLPSSGRVWATFAVLVCGASGAPALAQYNEEELAAREAMEEFLLEAKIVESEQMPQSEGVTEPYRLTLSLGDERHDCLWKNPKGRVSGFLEGWQYEIAAYEMDKYLGLNTVPATVEKRLKGERGSCQFWLENVWLDMDQVVRQKLKPPQEKVSGFNKMIYIQRAFDNLIANEDRHLGNILLTEDWRMFLIDHSRSFRSTKRHQKRLIFTERHPDGPKLMRKVPRTFLERIKALDDAKLREITGEYLTEPERAALLMRRDLILVELDKMIKKHGESSVLY